MDIGKAQEGNLRGIITDYSVEPQDTTGAEGSTDLRYTNTEWKQQYGYYLDIPELRVAVDAKANWTVGAGFEADEQTKLLLMTIKGNGKDTFNTILNNMIVVYTLGGDSYAEIIRDEKDGALINLKPLNPGVIEIVQNEKGRIKEYVQTARKKENNKTYKPEQIFHLSRKRIADSIKGISIIPAVEWIILARNEAMADWKKVLHRNVAPLWIFHLDTDNDTKITQIKTKMDKARSDGESMFVPKGAVVPELVNVAANSGLNPLQWINQLNDYFFQTVNVPQIIVGNAKEFTDASGKIVYLSYEQSVKGEQLYIEEQVLGQLNLEINLTFPATLQNELISSREKDPKLQAAQPNDTTAELEGNT